jgi:hypothetical protein
MFTLMACLTILIVGVLVVGSVISVLRRQGGVSLQRVGMTILLTLAALGVAGVLIWIFLLSQTHIG